MGKYILSFDQGTTSSRALLFDETFQVVGLDQIELRQIYPKAGYVEHDAMEIWQASLLTAQNAIKKAGISASEIVSIGITNQRETTVLWERDSGTPLYHAIVWQDRRTSEYCASLKQSGVSDVICRKTGLLADPYFSATKLRWLLQNIDGAYERALKGELCFGTVDSWLLWNLTGGKSHLTDATNASRTMLYNIHDGRWDEELLENFDIPVQLLPEVRDCTSDFGFSDEAFFCTKIPINGMAGDQHAALIGQGCFQAGAVKSTYGTGCFMLMNVGEAAVPSTNNLLSTLAYQIDGKRTYALEGSIFIAGAAVQWLRDEVGIIGASDECDGLAASSDMDDPVCLVPSFTGLGAPYWQPDVQGALFYLSRGTGRAEIVRATLESVGLQTKDLIEAMKSDWDAASDVQQILRVDGGLARSDWAMQFLADILQCPVDRPQLTETTALGAAYLAGLHQGIYPDFENFGKLWSLERQFTPLRAKTEMDEKYRLWGRAVAMLLNDQ